MELKDYEDLIKMFESDGWKRFIQTAVELEEGVVKGAVDIATTGDLWQYTRGQIHQLRSILGYENLIRANYEQLIDEGEEDAEDL